MPNKIAVSQFFARAEEIFWERNKKYGTKGMDIEKAVSLAGTKLDRIKNGDFSDSLIDLANYSLILHLLESGNWDEDVERPSVEKPQYEMFVHQEGNENLHTPKKQGDVGYDLACQADVEIPPHSELAVDVATGVRVKVPAGTWGLVINRSSTPRKKGLIVMMGVIDEGYTGPLFACVFNTTDTTIMVEKGERLAQLILVPSLVRPISVVEKMPETERGTSGFGSTS